MCCSMLNMLSVSSSFVMMLIVLSMIGCCVVFVYMCVYYGMKLIM